MDELALDRCLQIIQTEMVAHVAVVDDDGPYVAPVSYMNLGATIYFRTGEGRRMSAISNDPRVCLEVSRYDENTGVWESVVGFGKAQRIDDDTTAQEVISGLLSKYARVIGSPLSHGGVSPIAGGEEIVGVELTEFHGRSSGTWFSTTTRPGRL
jgi:nitroimidazol reductase NimA-like FMN-containing flavoprotein (pyridoxamine 5'-phosphate oxidase superfamily)